jgi:RNA polymerase sigma factor (sigma-70 family)
MVHDHGRAEDITQEVFMSALRRMRETERPIIFKPWVYEIAKNACIDAFRRSKRAEEISYDADEGLGSSDYGRLVSSTPTPDAAVDTRQSLDHLRGAFGGLSETHHDILVMRELEGLSYREIGRRLGMSRPSVESTLFRARRRLTEEYAELTSGERCVSVQSLIAGGGERRLGVRDERKLARHVSHCQPCRRAAYSAGFDVAALAAKQSLGRKVAALLPFPAFVKRWFGGGDAGGTAAKLSTAASQYAEPMWGWVKAAAVAATVAVAGAGAGVATTHGDPKTPTPAAQPAGVTPAAAQRQAGGATTSPGARHGARADALRRSRARRPAARPPRPRRPPRRARPRPAARTARPARTPWAPPRRLRTPPGAPRRARRAPRARR